MRRPPSLATIARYPVTVGVGVLAIIVTFAWWNGIDVSRSFMDYQAWHGQPWRLVTSALPHVNVLHLGFNLYWLWVFGTIVEEVFGQLRTTALLLLFAAGSAAAEYALLDGGVGLSGVGYGLFGLLWVLAYNDERFEDAIDGQTIGLFVVWFLACIVFTYTNIMPVGNVAHGVGALLGVLSGFAIASSGKHRVAWLGLLCVAVAMCLLGSSVARPYINLSRHPGGDIAYAAYVEQQAGNHEAAATLYRRALEYNSRDASLWYSLGIAYQHMERDEEAQDAYQRATDLEPRSYGYRHALANCKASLADRSQDAEEAIRLYKEAIALDDRFASYWARLSMQYVKLGRMELASDAMTHATELYPKDDK